MQAGQKLLSVEGAEIALLPMAILNVSQTYGVGTHTGSYMFDNIGAGLGKDPIFMPWTGRCVAIDPDEKDGHVVVMESLAPVFQPGVEYNVAGGIYDYQHFRFVHDDLIDVKVGDTYAQGVKVGDEGVAGNATGPHTHIGFGRGKYRGVVVSSGGYYKLVGEIKPEHAVFINDTRTIKTGGIQFKTYVPSMTSHLLGAVAYTTSESLRYRSAPDTDATALGVLPPKIKFPCVGLTKANDGHIWVGMIVGERLVYAALTFLTLIEVVPEQPVDIYYVEDGLEISVKSIPKGAK